jgi:NADH-quinone oxidoreductase subunit G
VPFGNDGCPKRQALERMTMPIYIDNVAYPAAPEKNLLEHVLSLGLDIPYFCWHPAMGSVGACRQCAVKQYANEHDEKGRIVMACMTAAEDGARIGLEEPEAHAFRAHVIEWLMVNHPHDCPVCEEGGECHLQDMTVMTGHDYRRYRGRKRTFRNQYIGPFVQHEMNRCIACYRCVRFYRDYAGGDDLDVFAAHNHVYFGRHEDGVLENEFSGNLVEVCPTGVFTDKPFSDHYVRKWDLQGSPSVCVHCSLGCNITPQERYGVLRRVLNRYNHEVNGYFLCDRGRYGYGFVNAEARVRRPLARADGSHELEPVAADDAVGRAAVAIASGEAIGIGSPRASLEANFVLRRLVGAENFYVGVSALEHRLVSTAAEVLTAGSTRAPSLSDAAEADAVLVLGEDVTNTAPRLALALRQTRHRKQMAVARKLKVPSWQDAAVRSAGQDERAPLFIATPDATKLDSIAGAVWRAAPEDIASLGFAVAHRLDPAAPDAEGLSAEAAELADRIAATLEAAERPMIVSGSGARSAAVIEAAANAARALSVKRGRPADLALTLPEANSLGLWLLGGRPLEDGFERARAGGVQAAVVLENDLFRRAGRQTVERFIDDVEHFFVIDQIDHATARKAEVVLPAAAFAEADGTLISSEGRAQRFVQTFVADGEVRESWRWLVELIRRMGGDCDWRDLDDVVADCAREAPLLARILDAAPNASFRVAGQRINREPARYSGRTAMHADIDLRERPPPPDPDSALSFSMEGYHGRRLPSALIPYFWAPAWNSVQSVNKFQDEVGGALRGGDPGVRLLEPKQAEQAPQAAAKRGRSRKAAKGGPRETAQGDRSQPSRKAAKSDRSPRAYYGSVPGRSAPPDGKLRVVALHHIFGSEELSALSPPIAERAPRPYVALNPDEAAERSLADGDSAEVVFAESVLTLPLRVEPQLVRGAVGLPLGLGDLPEFPASDERWAAIRPAAGGKSVAPAPAAKPPIAQTQTGEPKGGPDERGSP